MTHDDFERALERLRRQKPFRPFAIDLTNGERVEVWSPDAVRIDGEDASVRVGERWFGYEGGDVARVEELPRREVRVMTREEWEAELRRLIWQEPFRPFVIELKSGERAEVVASHAVGFGGGNGSAVLPGNVPVLFRLTDIARIIETQATPAAHAS